MSSFPKDQPASKAGHADGHDASSSAPSSSIHKRRATPEFRRTPDQNHALARPATTCAPHPPSESSETTMQGSYDPGMLDIASSVTLQDEFPWHEVGINKDTQGIPSTIFPPLLQGVSDISPSSRTSLDEGSGVSTRYSAAQKGKWKARKDGDVMHESRCARSPSPQFHFEGVYSPVEEWVLHNRPILQDYADRQKPLPLGHRLEVSIDEPSRFILGAVQLLVNRDQRGCTDRSRQFGPQLIENFVDIDLWANEYFRSRHGARAVDSHVLALLTIVINNFYEGQVQLIDRLVGFALENMRFCGRSSLGVEDFAFGFDFKMSQDLPFYVETSSQIREPLPIRAVEVGSAMEPAITRFGRRVKPTSRAQAGVEQAQTNAGARRNKGEHVQDRRAAGGSVPAVHQKKGLAQPSSDRGPCAMGLAPSTSTSERPVPTLPGSPSTPSRLDSKSKPSASASENSPIDAGSSGPNFAARSVLRMKLRPPALHLSTLTAPARSDSKSALSTTNCLQARALEATNDGRGGSASGGTGPEGPRGRGNASATPDRALPTARPVGAGNAAAVRSAVARPTLVDARLGRAGGATSRARPRGPDSGMGARDDGPKPESIRAGTDDPGHPQGKKRKLDD